MSSNRELSLSNPENNQSITNNSIQKIEDLNGDSNQINQEDPLSSFQEDVLNDRIFIRDRHKRVKVLINDILYLEASRNYCKVVSTDSEYLISGSMKAIEEKINSEKLYKIHRSFVVNIEKIDALLYDNYVLIRKKEIPVSKSCYEDLVKMMRFI
jgi:DNA-binding LytR/AlgR family response regulator